MYEMNFGQMLWLLLCTLLKWSHPLLPIVQYRKRLSKKNIPCPEHLRLLGRKAYLHYLKARRKKFDFVSKTWTVVSYTSTPKNHRLCDQSRYQPLVSATASFREAETFTSMDDHDVPNTLSVQILEMLLLVDLASFFRSTEEGRQVDTDRNVLDPFNYIALDSELVPASDEPAAPLPTIAPHIPISHLSLVMAVTYERADSDDSRNVASIFYSTSDEVPNSFLNAVNSMDTSNSKTSIQTKFDTLIRTERCNVVPAQTGKCFHVVWFT